MLLELVFCGKGLASSMVEGGEWGGGDLRYAHQAETNNKIMEASKCNF